VTEPFDLAVVGAGPGGYVCAARAVELGLRVAVMEPAELGGVCLNRGCIPTKGLLDGPDPDGIGARVRRNAEAIARLRRGVAHLLKGATVLAGRARLTGTGRLEVEGHGTVAARRVVLATGSRPRALAELPFDGARVISSDEAVALERVPGRVAVIGAGAVGCEFADVLAAYGADVTLVEAAERLLPAEDPWAAKLLARAFDARGIAVRTATRVAAAETGPEGVRLTLAGVKGTEAAACDLVLVAVGRQANVEGLGLERVGLEVVDGIVPVDGAGRTAVPGVFAIGDLTGPPLLAHRASAQGRAAAEAAAGREPEPVAPGRIPACVYTHPQIATVGARPEAGDVVGEAFFRANGLGVVTGRTEGGVRLVAEADGGRLKGAQLVGAGVTEQVGLLGVAVAAGLTVRDLARGVFPHPTLSESVHEAAEAALKRL